MKKITIISAFGLLLVLLVSGCTFNNIAESSGASKGSFLSNPNAEVKAWQSAYTELLEGIQKKETNFFGVRDLDNNGVPELLLIQQDENALNAILTVYSYDMNIKKIGNFTNASTSFVEGFRFSKKPGYPGLFESWHGGGVEHYGYLSIKEGKLVHEDLWLCDRTKEPPHQEEISKDKQLINESIDVYLPYDYAENLLEIHLVSNGNFNRIIK